ncbi:MAG: TrkH family potassium uptake protein [Firmicutes bacterium]|nr:TrkH family potassium uptake protein [Bacillota bacterium]
MFKNLQKKAIIKVMGALTFIEGLALLPCFVISLVYDNSYTVYTFLIISLAFIILGFISLRYLRKYRFRLKAHEGFLMSTLCWVYCSLLGALPFFFSGHGYTFIECFFESAAGFTTTCSTVMDLDIMAKGLILWRAILSWLGGMGILVLLVSILPALGIGGQKIAQTETTGPSLEKMSGRFSSTGQFLYITYTVFTLVEFLLLVAGPLSPFDAFVNTCSSISTGGLLVTMENAAAFDTVYIRVVIIMFTLLSSMNFSLYYYMLNGRKKALTGNAEVRGFWLIIIVATILITLDLIHEDIYTNAFTAFKDAISQVISFISTSGYYVRDYTQWPTFSVMLLFILLLIGGCSMSTSGSLKVIRVMVLFKLVLRGIFKQIHPSSVKAVKISGKAISAERVGEITAHILLYFMVLIFSCIIVSLNNLDMTTTITSVLGSFTNTGISLGGPGPLGNYAVFNQFTMLYLSFLMIVGRLEMFAVIILFTRSFRRINSVEPI